MTCKCNECSNCENPSHYFQPKTQDLMGSVGNELNTRMICDACYCGLHGGEY